MYIHLFGGLIASGAVCLFYPKSGFAYNSKLKKQWKELMEEKKLKNSLGNTYTIKSIKTTPENTQVLILEIPPGLMVNKLEEIKPEMEVVLGGDVNIEWCKYDKNIKVTVNKSKTGQK